MQDRLLAIVGPTGVGKSSLALKLAKALGGEIVSADSRQVYRGMDIGTAKPSLEDRRTLPHHLIDLIDPDQDYSLAIFLWQATRAIREIQERSKLPILVGGTGQYVWALLEGWQVPEVPPNPQLRRCLEEQARAEGYAPLHAELSRVNQTAASRIDPRNVRRVVRALEVSYSQKEGESVNPRKRPPRYKARLLGLTLNRSSLYKRIDRRVDSMMESSWVDEVHTLLDRGYSPRLPSLSSLGYRELVQYLAGDLKLDTAVERIKHRTHRFARQQYAWFRPSDARIRWFDAESGLDEAGVDVAGWTKADWPV